MNNGFVKVAAATPKIKVSNLRLEHFLGQTPVDARKTPGGLRLGKAAVGVDCGRSVGDDVNFKAFAGRIDGREGDAVVERETADPDVGDAALAQESREPRLRFVVRGAEGGIAVDVHFPALSQDDVGLRDVDAFDFGALCPFNAMDGPEHLRAVRQIDHVKHVLSFMIDGKGDVARRVPVLRHDDAVPGMVFEHGTDDRHGLVAAGNAERASGQKILLQIDDDQGVLSDGLCHIFLLRQWWVTFGLPTAAGAEAF